MQTSAAGRKAITEREGLRLRAYQDSVSVWTIGVGHTSAAGLPRVTPGLSITAAQADEILSRDLASFETAVGRALKVEVTQNQFDALVSLAFNIGGGAFAGSTLVRKLNAGDIAGAADAFLSWDKAGGRVLAGLHTRRVSERAQFLTVTSPAMRQTPAPAAPTVAVASPAPVQAVRPPAPMPAAPVVVAVAPEPLSWWQRFVRGFKGES